MKVLTSSFLIKNWLPLSIGLVLRLIKINSPIVGIHAWRQADTAAMARHFYINNSPIWLPQIDWAGSGEGFVESEFPIFPYIVGQIYKLVGLNEWVGRGLSVLFSVLTIIFIIKIGELFFDSKSAWWGGVIFAISPIAIYYGRTFQAESLMLLLSSFSLERFIQGLNRISFKDIFLSWLAFTIAILIKVIPVVWLGFPIIGSYILYKKGYNFKSFSLKNSEKRIGITSIIIYFSSSIIVLFLWYLYAYHLGKESELSFGFWGSDRSSIKMLLDVQVWLNLFIKVCIRNYGIFSLPFLILGINYSKKNHGSKILILGILGLFLTTIIAFRSSSIHEYYQLPLLIFTSPLIGKGLVEANNYIKNRNLTIRVINIFITLTSLTSLVVLSIDYYAVESYQAKIWMPLALRVRSEVKPNERIVSVTRSDPTLLNLARRQGWLTTPENVTQENLNSWFNEGATHIVGNLNWRETYSAMKNKSKKAKLKSILCRGINPSQCLTNSDFSYVIPLDNLIKE